MNSPSQFPTMATKEAYSAIRNWYLSHVNLVDSKMAEMRDVHRKLKGNLEAFDRNHARRLALIAALPPASDASEMECLAIFDEVMAGLLECAYGESDGSHTMAQYVQAAIGAGPHHCLSADQRATLSGSSLWPYLSFNRD